MLKAKNTKCVILLMLFAIGGCGTPYILPSSSSKGAMATLPEEASNRIVGVAISGGGSRAATFTAAVLRELAMIDVGGAEGHVSFLEKIGYMSSVSGGSLAGAYYAVKKPEKGIPILDGDAHLSSDYVDFFKNYRIDMERDWEGSLWSLAIGDSTARANTIIAQWDKHLFHNATFRDLRKREEAGDAPRMILNGTSWDTGRRFLFTTLPKSSFSYEFVGATEKYLENYLPKKEYQRIEYRLRPERERFNPLTFEDIQADLGPLNISVAVASSSSVPLVIGPVLYKVGDKGNAGPYLHIGDGGMFDNLGIESLAQVFFEKLRSKEDGPPTKDKGLIVVIDASYPFGSADESYGKARNLLELLKQSPSRISDIMEQRAQSYQLLLWGILRADSIRGPQIVPDPEHLQIVYLRHTDGAAAIVRNPPEKCKSRKGWDSTQDGVQGALSHIPTRFRIEKNCNAAMLEMAAKEVVSMNKERILQFFRGN